MNKFLPKNLTSRQLIATGALAFAGVTSLLLIKSYFNGGVCKLAKDLTGKVIIITGANSGIGKETAAELARLGATVILACRDIDKTLAVVSELQSKTDNPSIDFIQLDLSDMSSIRGFVEEFKSRYDRLDVLINNAGIVALPERKLTKDGFEVQFATNYIGPFYLTNLLLDFLKKSPPSRVINVSSVVHTAVESFDWENMNSIKNYHPFKAYFVSKLAMSMFTRELQRRLDLEGAEVKVVSLHPGAVRTEAFRNLTGFGWKLGFLLLSPFIYFASKSSKQGAQTSIYLAQEEYAFLKAGAYYSDCKVAKENPYLSDTEATSQLWNETTKLLTNHSFTEMVKNN